MNVMDQSIDTTSQADQEPWAKLISVNSNLANISLYNEANGISGNFANEIPSFGQQGTLKISKDAKGYWVEILSSFGELYIDDDLLQNGEKKKIRSGDIIYLLHPTKVQQSEVKGYIFSGLVSDNIDFKRRREEELDNLREEEEIGKQVKLQEEIDEEMFCGFCHDYVFQCVTANPCLHNFCGACLTEWVKHATKCPKCLEEVVEVRRNYVIANKVRLYLQANPSKRRFFKDYLTMQAKNKLRKDRIILKRFLDHKISNGTNLSAPTQGRLNSNLSKFSRAEQQHKLKDRANRQIPAIKAARKCVAWMNKKDKDDSNSDSDSNDDDESLDDTENEEGSEEDYEDEFEEEYEEEKDAESVEDQDGMEDIESVECYSA